MTPEQKQKAEQAGSKYLDKEHPWPEVANASKANQIRHDRQVAGPAFSAGAEWQAANPPEVSGDVSFLASMPFRWDRLQRNTPYDLGPDPEKYRSRMDPATFEEYLKHHNDAEALAVFDLLRVEWEGCDCGGDYGCSHGYYPIGIGFYSAPGEAVKGVDTEVSEFGEDEQMCIDYDNKRVVVNTGKCTMLDFYHACKYLGLPLFFKEAYKPNAENAATIESLKQQVIALQNENVALEGELERKDAEAVAFAEWIDQNQIFRELNEDLSKGEWGDG